MSAVQSDLVAELEAARDLVATMPMAAAARHRQANAAMIVILRNYRGYVEAHGKDGKMRITFDVGSAAKLLGKLLGQ